MGYSISDMARRDPCFQGDRTPRQHPDEVQIKVYRIVDCKRNIKRLRKRLAASQDPNKTYNLVKRLIYNLLRMRELKDNVKICQVIAGDREMTSNIRTCKPKNKMNNGGV